MLTKEEIDHVLDIIDRSGMTQVQVTGGEAVTHPNIEYIVDKLVDMGIKICFTTSGIIVNDDIFKYLKKIKKVNGSHVRVSLDGNKKTHNDIRMNELAYDNAIKFINKCTENDLEVRVVATIMGQSKEELEELVATSKNLNVDMIELGDLILKGEAVENNLFSKIDDKQEFRKYLNKKYKNDKFSVKVAPDVSCVRNCGAGYQLIGIKPNMDVVPCATIDFKLGNLNELTFEQMMQSFGEKFNELEAPCKKYCSECEEERNCSGCLAQGLTFKNIAKECKWIRTQKNYLGQLENV